VQPLHHNLEWVQSGTAGSKTEYKSGLIGLDRKKKGDSKTEGKKRKLCGWEDKTAPLTFKAPPRRKREGHRKAGALRVFKMGENVVAHQKQTNKKFLTKGGRERQKKTKKGEE